MVWVFVLPNVLCPVCADYVVLCFGLCRAPFSEVFDGHMLFSGCYVPWADVFVAYMAWRCCCLMGCAVICAPLSGDPRCNFWLWVVFLIHVLGAPWHLVLFPLSILVYLSLPSSLLHHSLDVFIAFVLFPCLDWPPTLYAVLSAL